MLTPSCHALVSFPSLIHRRVKARSLTSSGSAVQSAQGSLLQDTSQQSVFDFQRPQWWGFCLSPWDPVLQPQKCCCQEALAKLQHQFEFQAFASAANAPAPGQADLSFRTTGNRSVGTQLSGSLPCILPMQMEPALLEKLFDSLIA